MDLTSLSSLDPLTDHNIATSRKLQLDEAESVKNLIHCICKCSKSSSDLDVLNEIIAQCSNPEIAILNGLEVMYYNDRTDHVCYYLFLFI